MTRKRLISKEPTSDIVLILYALFALGVWDIGRKHFWTVILNVSLAHCKKNHFFANYRVKLMKGARLLIEAKRPVEYDRSMQPSTDIAADSFGYQTLLKIAIYDHCYIDFRVWKHICRWS